jgi:trans-2,3-dihydro-3-hydroxyanthranilate isomerase
MTQPLPRIEPYRQTAQLMAALGVPGSTLPVELYDNGPHYVFVERDTPDEIAALTPDLARLAALGSTAFSVFARKGPTWKCRVFAPGEGINEDPATGAAAGPLAVHLARHGRIAFGDEIVIEQGLEIARPSTLHAGKPGPTGERRGRRTHRARGTGNLQAALTLPLPVDAAVRWPVASPSFDSPEEKRVVGAETR